MSEARSSRLHVIGCVVVLLVAARIGNVVRRADDETNLSARLGSGKFFDGFASSYDTLNRLISLGLDQSWRRAAALAAMDSQRLRGIPAETSETKHASALDVATGTGDLALILERSGKFNHVVALDPSQKMLAVLRGRESSRVRVVEGVAEALPFEDSSFDAVTVAFGVRNFENRRKGLQEMARVLKPGGHLVVLEVAMPSARGPVNVAARVFVSGVVPAVGALVSGRYAAYSYLSRSMAEFPGPEVFKGMLQDAGLSLVAHRRLWPFGVGPYMYTAVKS